MTMAARTRALLKKILYTPNPLRIKDCAGEFGVSERTIKYDIESIRMWLANEGIEIKSKPSTGIWIECPEEERDRILRKMDEDKEHRVLNQQERIQHITLELLLSNEETTVGRIASKLEITRNTALSDLAQSETFLRKWDLKIERSRKGIKIIGAYEQKRLVLEKLVHSMLDSSNMLQIVQGAAAKREPRLHFSSVLEQFLKPAGDLNAVFEAIGALVEETEQETGVLLSDQAIIGIFVRLCIIIPSGGGSRFPSGDDGMRGRSPGIFLIFKRVLSEFSLKAGIDISDNDIWFVCLQAVSMIPSPADSRKGQKPLLPDAFMITKRLVEAVSRSMDPALAKDPDLLNHLLAHISRKLTQYSYGVVEPNPMLNDIMSAYRGMFEAVKAASIEVYGPYRIYLTDSEIGYIVVYFQTAFERLNEQRSIQTLVVCGTGKGTSRLLKTVIERQIPKIRVAGSCSVMELKKKLQEGDYDLVISLFPVDIPLPSVVVSSIPGKRDFQAIQEKIAGLDQGVTKTREASGPWSMAVNPKVLNPEIIQPWFQEMVFSGFELSRQIAAELGGHLNSDRMEGLTLHLIFMMQRIAFQTQYEDHRMGLPEAGQDKEREGLIRILTIKGLQITEAELQAILKYLEHEG